VALFGGHRPPLQMPICKITLKLHIAAVATGVDRRKYIFPPALRDHPKREKEQTHYLILLIKMYAYALNQKSKLETFKKTCFSS